MSNTAQFENGFIERTYPSIVSDMSIAFAELVANSWDAGATRVDITIPDKKGEPIKELYHHPCAYNVGFGTN